MAANVHPWPRTKPQLNTCVEHSSLAAHEVLPSTQFCLSLEAACPASTQLSSAAALVCIICAGMTTSGSMVCAPGRSFQACLHRTVTKDVSCSLLCSVGASIIIISTDGSIRAPVITLQGEKSNPYGVVEKHFRPDILIGAERFWKVGPSCLCASAAQAAVESQCWMAELHLPACCCWRKQALANLRLWPGGCNCQQAGKWKAGS